MKSNENNIENKKILKKLGLSDSWKKNETVEIQMNN